MRKFQVKTGAVIVAIAVSISSTTFADPLAPGKPAGVHQAEMSQKEWLVFGGIAAVAAGVAIVAAGGGHKNNSSGPALTVIIPATTT